MNTENELRKTQSVSNSSGLNPYFAANILSRNRIASLWRVLFQLATVIGLIVLALLLYTVINKSGYPGSQWRTD